MTLTEINSQLGRAGSDKGDGWHQFNGVTYLDVYQKAFSPMAECRIKLLEIGVLNGGSLRMWREFFPKADIIGLDIDPQALGRQPKGCAVIIGDQSDAAFVKQVSDERGPFDIVVDDGSHVATHAMASFEALWPSMPSGAIYAIEDTGMFYVEKLDTCPGMALNKPGWKSVRRAEFDPWLLGKIQMLDGRGGDIQRIEIHCMQILFFKA